MLKAVLAAVVAVAVSACSSGPDAVDDGSFRLYASSVGASFVEATLDVAGDSIRIATPDGEQTVNMSGEGEEIVLCPSSTQGRSLLLDAPVTLGSQLISEPAIFGDCGELSPLRVTLIDLDGLDDDLLPPYTNWAEFCDVTDPDC